MKPDELGASIGFALFLLALHQRGILVRAWAAIVAPIVVPPEQPELEAGKAELARADELTRDAIERARAA